jgi:hypothetical protein
MLRQSTVLSFRPNVALVVFPLLLLLPLLATGACGGRSGLDDPTPTPAPDASTTIWDEGLPDAAAPLEDTGTGVESSLDAAPPEHVDHDPLAHCQSSSARDAFYVNVAGTVVGPVGFYAPGSETFTNLDSYVEAESPYEIWVHRVSGEGDSLAILTADGGALAPGHYDLGSSSAPALALTLGFSLAQCAAASGTLDVVDSKSVTDDAGDPVPSSTLLAYDIQCQNSSGSVPIEGCARYAPSPAFDAGLPPSAADDDAGVLAPCASGGDVFYVDNDGITGAPASITGAVGTWSAGIDFSPAALLQFDANLFPQWELALAGGSITPGTYTFTNGYDGTSPGILVVANGVYCDYTTATVTIAALQTTPGANDAPGDDITRFLVGFDMDCTSYPLRGCMSFGKR